MRSAQGRGDWRGGTRIVAVVLLAVLPGRGLAEPGPLPRAGTLSVENPLTSSIMRSDARLHAVHFVDFEFGWAVGDRGTIWHTEDGGVTWSLQESDTDCTLCDVCFVDRRLGWAVGGSTQSYTHAGRGVVLVTRDGGRSWFHDAKAILPQLQKVRFVDASTGWALGGASEMFPSGILTTDDGGKTWSPLPGDRTTGWRDGDFASPWNGAATALDGKAATVRDGAATPARNADFGLRAARRVHLVPPVHGWLVGQGGLVMTTGDLGYTWQLPPGQLPLAARDQFDFHALSVVGPRVWIAGNPGSRILHSPDAGRTWQMLATGQHIPLRDLHFVDSSHGFAVGDLGVILRTVDGGTTWDVARRGGARAALLGVFGSPQDVPLELFAQLSGDEGYLGVVDLLARRDIETRPTSPVPVETRAQEALVGVGGSAVTQAWQFPVRRRGLWMPEDRILDGWNNAHDGRAVEQLEAHLVRTIRTWRPDVLVTHPASTDDDPLGSLLHTAVLAAVEAAGDPTRHARQITEAGLQAWSVKRVLASTGAGAGGGIHVTASRIATRLGCSPAELTARPRSLIHDALVPAPETIGFQLVRDERPGAGAVRGVFTGIILSPGGDARRKMLPTHADNLDTLRRLAQRRRNTTAILEQAKERATGGAELLAQAAELTRGLDADNAAGILYHLGSQYHRTGQWKLAAQAFRGLVDRYPDHSLARPALLWLVRYYAAGEATWRVQDGSGAEYNVRQASTAPGVDPTAGEDRPELAALAAREIEQYMPDLHAAPEVGFPLAVANRLRGYPAQAERYFLTGVNGAADPAWQQCARAERWLLEPQDDCPKPRARCLFASAKPRLDGDLSDAAWGGATPVNLRSALGDDAGWPAFVMTAHDEEYLYVAVCCQKAPDATYPEGKGARPRDPDLTQHDRVEVYLDIDRDYSTAYQFTVDHRGWVAEACWGDFSWNPTWYVASGCSGDNWIAEVAIPWNQLTGAIPGDQTAWALGVQRIVPGVGFQSWTQPAEIEARGEGFGLICFE